MKLVSLFISLSCASAAAFIPKFSRSLAVEFNRQRHQNAEELPKFHVPVGLPKMPSMSNPLPIAFCDDLPPSRYFGSFILDALEDSGLINYHDIIETATRQGTFVISNWAIDQLIARHQPELASPNYKIDSNKSREQITLFTPAKYYKEIPIKKVVFFCDNIGPDQIDKFNFYKKLFLIFHDSSAESDPNEPSWKAELRRQDLRLVFVDCDL